MNQPGLYEPYAHESTIEKMRLFRKLFSPNPGIVYYPGCSSDNAPSLVFPESRLIYVDLTESDIKSLRAKGYEAYCANAHEFIPDVNPDILILLNTGVQPEIVAEHLPVNGYVLCNEYFRSATAMRKMSSFQLLGVIDYADGMTQFDTTSLDEYWQEVETDEELETKRSGPIIADQVREYALGEVTSILAEYRKLRERAKEEAELVGMPERPYFLDMMQGVALHPLPMKKGNADSFFVFQRVFRSLTDLSFTPL